MKHNAIVINMKKAEKTMDANNYFHGVVQWASRQSGILGDVVQSANNNPNALVVKF